jgi:hypothetical protein
VADVYKQTIVIIQTIRGGVVVVQELIPGIVIILDYVKNINPVINIKLVTGFLNLFQTFNHQTFFAVAFGDFAFQGYYCVFDEEVFCCFEKF